ncbi:MAG TPA: SRPBCC domain-containing protein [Bryobacteraceae bacterium]|nr:SRPBCC domain-containing protein [Bryobacteraceae bacterium]
MAATISEQTVHALKIVREEEIAAPIDVVFETVLEQMGPMNETPTAPMPMILEAWPGGRWYRDLGNGAGHFWGNVQAIKPPSLLEICGPLFMSYPAVSNIQYRLREENGITRLTFTHRAMGQISHDPEIEESWNQIASGWGNLIERICSAAAAVAK